MATQAEIEISELREAINSGALKVSYSQPGGGTKAIEYRSLAEMKTILADMINAQTPASCRRRFFLPNFDKGY
jgi:hypothetical protein